ncbi:MAG: hypoxanthine phosphoribosyltransferase [Gaiellales bacterium]|nr:hypoxanthine phosphoribosyltransferase [Gaiellales bacterium]
MIQQGVIGPVYLDGKAIAARVTEMGREITQDYEGGNLLLLSVLKGTVFFMADLARAVSLPLEMDYVAISSYQQDHDVPGASNIQITKDAGMPLFDKDVLVVEDIIDTGLTLYYILRFLAAKQPRSLEVCTLLDRPYRRLVDLDVRYRGFTVPDTYFVGYGFDYRQLHRNLPHLAELNV